MSGSGHYGRSGPDQQLRKLEKEAYVAVLRAFTSQSEVITWRKEQLLVTLRQELRISDEQHLEVLRGMDSNAAPQQFRDQRLSEEEHGGSMYAPNVDMVAASRKKPKTSHSLQANLPPPPMKSAFPSPPPPAPVTSHAKRAPPAGGSRSKKSKGGRQHANASSSKPLPFGGMPPGEGLISGINPWVGKRVKIRWPEDNVFYEAVISDWDPEKDLHALVYEMNTEQETWEWVDLKELSSNDLQTIDGPLVNVTGKNPPSNFGVGGRGTTGRGSKKGAGRNNLMSSYGGWGRPSSKGPSNSLERSTPGIPARNWKTSNAENGLDSKGLKQLQVPSLEALVKQVDRIAEEDDLAKIESIKRAAKEHEDMLRKALAEVGESSEEGESDEENVPFSHTHSVERERERRSRQDSRDQHGYDDEDDTAGDRDEGSDGEPMAAHGGVASDADDHHDGDDW
ncbi:hypothetical protein GOP47_0012878 [Adiantum capillus-veneris]|nr:hypothetical protein GOP47_0012878 [Adiantum capillus-veneris]